MSINIADGDILDKIALVEGQLWKEDQEISASLATEECELEMFTTAWAHARWGGRPASRPVIYGLCGTHRYMVQEDGEVMFSSHHGLGHIAEAKAAGFRIFR